MQLKFAFHFNKDVYRQRLVEEWMNNHFPQKTAHSLISYKLRN